MTTELACRTLPVVAVYYDNNTSGDTRDVRAGMSNVTCDVVAVSDHNTSGDTRDDRAGRSNVTCGGGVRLGVP